jgi:hypothetical protein
MVSISRDESTSSAKNNGRHKKRIKTKNLMFALFACIWCLFAITGVVYLFFFNVPENVKQASPQQTPLTMGVQGQDWPGEFFWPAPLPPASSQQDHHRLRHMVQPKSQWDSRYHIVHVILMRFMQHQPELLHLGQARLDLFQAITLPSILQQTNQDFLLIIRTDPNLHPTLKESMLATLQHVPNAVVVASNKVVEGFREVGMVDINETSMVSGSFALVQSYHEMAQYSENIVLETRLDADDALSLTFVENIQRRAHKIWVAKKHEGVAVVRPDEEDDFLNDWRVWCPGPHINWHFYSPWDSKSTTGSLIPMSTIPCITPGLTFGFQVDAKFLDVGLRQHQELHSRLKKCEQRPTRCLERLSGGLNGEPVALRARAPTSAGMKDVVPTMMTNTAFYRQIIKAKQAEYWATLPKIFGLDPAAIWAMRLRLEANLPDIVTDGLIGQCTGGHSCKNSSAVALRSLLNMSLVGVNANM